MTSDRELTGLGGWLTLVGLNVVFTPLRNIISVWQVYPPMFSSGTWEALTAPGSAAYHPVWAPLIASEIIFNLAFIALGAWMIYLFFARSHFFPKVFVGVLIARVVLHFADAYVAHYATPDLPLFDSETGPAFLMTLIFSAVLLPYILFSRRVRLTFAKKEKRIESHVSS
jgi:hypothetical protein